MKLNGNNVYKIGSILPVALEVEGLSPDVDITAAKADFKVTFYTVDECNGMRIGKKEVTYEYNNDDDKFRSTDEHNVFVAQVDTAGLDEGRIAGSVSFEIFDSLANFAIHPDIPFLTDYIIKSW